MGHKARTSIPLLRFDGGGAGVHVDLDQLVASRLMIQANSGGGKSWALRYLLEQTFGQVPHLVLDSEGEFMTLRERFPYVLAGKGGDVAVNPKIAKHTARRLVEVGASAVIDLYELRLHERREYVRLFVNELLSLPRKLWTPYLVILDEAHKYAPEGGKSDCREEVVSLCSQGRKRGLCPILATQRLSKLAKDAAAELANKMIGRTGLDLDMKRAADELGLDRAGRQGLKDLVPGTFYVYGPAIEVGGVSLVQTGDVETTHPEPGKVAATPPPAPAEVASVLEQLQDLEREAEEEERTIASQAKRIRELEVALRKAETSLPEPEPIVEEVEVPAVDEELLGELVEVHKELGGEIPRLIETMAGVGHALDDFNERSERVIRELEALKNGRPAPAPRARPTRTRPSTPARSDSITSDRVDDPAAREELSGPEQRILDALAWFESIGVRPVNNAPACFVAGYKNPRSGAYMNPRGSLSAKGLINYPRPDMLELTGQGRALASAPDSPLDTADLHQMILRKLSGPESRVLEPLLRAYPDSLSNEELCEAAGYSNPRSGAYMNPRGRLSSLGMLEYPEPNRVAASPLLFLEDR